MEQIPLSTLPLGACAKIVQVRAGGDMARRLADLGFVPGTAVECALISPAGDPAAYRLRGSLIALRRQDAGCIAVSPAAPPGGEDSI